MVWDWWYVLLSVFICLLIIVSIFTTLATLHQEFNFTYDNRITNFNSGALTGIEISLFILCIFITRLTIILNIHTSDVVWFYGILRAILFILAFISMKNYNNVKQVVILISCTIGAVALIIIGIYFRLHRPNDSNEFKNYRLQKEIEAKYKKSIADTSQKQTELVAHMYNIR